MLYHLKPNGRAGIVLANGSMSSSQNSEGEIRRAMVEADVVEVMIALPGQLFFNTQIPARSLFGGVRRRLASITTFSAIAAASSWPKSPDTAMC
jgi:hypothetical protein